MRGIDFVFADDINAKKNGVKIDIPGLQDQYFIIAAFDATKITSTVNKIKHFFYDEIESPTAEEKNNCFKSAVVENIIKGWHIYESGEIVEFSEKNLKRIFLDEKYSRLFEFVLDESQKIEHFKMKELEDAKKK